MMPLSLILAVAGFTTTIWLGMHISCNLRSGRAAFAMALLTILTAYAMLWLFVLPELWEASPMGQRQLEYDRWEEDQTAFGKWMREAHPNQ